MSPGFESFHTPTVPEPAKAIEIRVSDCVYTHTGRPATAQLPEKVVKCQPCGAVRCYIFPSLGAERKISAERVEYKPLDCTLWIADRALQQSY
ncbi:hypothetical protein RRF57_010428 [Xylaria bambusicola]|uniref:Uncharacterized protein n=1 Tax=Xylaria bambusicola TaxID=326684 RepID=A0AAN7Z2R3_9PEZI